MTKEEIVYIVSEETGVSRTETKKVLESFFSNTKKIMADGNNLYIRHFGSFVVKKKARKIGRNISKNSSVIIEEHFAPYFRPAQEFTDQVKENVKVETPELVLQ